MGRLEVEQFLTHFAVALKVSPTTQNQALCAIILMYRHVFVKVLSIMSFQFKKNLVRVPKVLSHNDAVDVIDKLQGIHHTIGTLMYGARFRISEVLKLRINNFDFSRNTIFISRS
jgi:integrase